MTIPQVVGMYKNDRTRKEILVDFGFRLPSALDNRPLTFEEFAGDRQPGHLHERDAGPVRARAQPSRSSSSSSGPPVLVDPQINVRPTRARSTTCSARSGVVSERGERSLVTTLTKKMAEDLTDYLKETGGQGPLPPLARSRRSTASEILRDLRLGVYDVARRHQPPARGSRPARGHPGGDPRCRQGRLPAFRTVAHPDDRPGGPTRQRAR